MRRREAEKMVVGLVAEASAVREARRELTRRLRRIREEVGRLLPLAEGGGGRKNAAPGVLAESGAEVGEKVHARRVAPGARERNAKVAKGGDK